MTISRALLTTTAALLSALSILSAGCLDDDGGPVSFSVAGKNMPCGTLGLMTIDIVVTSHSGSPVTLETLTSGGEDMDFDGAVLASGATASFVCSKSTIDRGDRGPQPMTATILLGDGQTVTSTGQVVLLEGFDNCDTFGSPTFTCEPVPAS